MAKAFFHDYPCTLAKIVGVYKIKTVRRKEVVQSSPSALAAANDAPQTGHSAALLQGQPASAVDGGANLGAKTMQDLCRGIIDPDDQADYIKTLNFPNEYKATKKSSSNSVTTKKYILVMENLNFGLTAADEKHLIRFDLKGSTTNRFVDSSF